MTHNPSSKGPTETSGGGNAVIAVNTHASLLQTRCMSTYLNKRTLVLHVREPNVNIILS